MKEAEYTILEMTQAVFILHSQDWSESKAVEILREEEGFKDVSLHFVEAIYGQLSKEIKNHYKNVGKASYYKIADTEDYVTVWSERYLLFEKPESEVYKFEVYDIFNDKST
jgi:hypothetical protein